MPKELMQGEDMQGEIRPNEYCGPEAHHERNVLVRPVKSEDVTLYRELFHSLSDDTIHQRFFIALNEPPQQVLEWFKDPTGGQKAFVAVQEHEGRERMLGIARLIVEDNPRRAEFAVLVGDRWQGQGIGSELMRRCLEATYKLGVRTVRGVAMPHNSKLIALAKALGFSIRLATKARLVILEWDAPW